MGYTPFDSSRFGVGGFTNPMDEEAERRKREAMEQSEQTQLRQSMATDPSFDDPVEDVGGRLPEPSQARESTQPDLANQDSYLQEYAEHIRTRPDQSDYEPSTLRKILSVIGGTLAGGDPNVTRSLAGYGKYDAAMQDWEATGEGLGTVAEIERQRRGQDVSMRGQDVTARGQDITQGTAAAGQPAKDITAQAAADRAEETARAGPVGEKMRGEEIALEGRRAGTGEKRAGIYGESVANQGRNVDSLIESRAAGGTDPKMSATQQTATDSLALQRVLDMNPEFEKYVQTDEEGNMLGMGIAVDNPDSSWWIPGDDEDIRQRPPEDDPDWQEFMMAYEQAKAEIERTAGLADVSPLGGGQ